MDAAATEPLLLGFPVAVLALTVAILGFLVSLVALGWQVAKHALDGGRVRIYLNAATVEAGVRLTTNRSGKWSMRQSSFGNLSRENIEVAQLVVENPGRTPITIHSPGFLVLDAKKKPHTVSPKKFELRNYGPDSATIQHSVRIEPYDRVTFLFDYWPIIPRLLSETGNSRVRLLGCAQVAGHRRLRTSKRRLAWSIPRGSWTAYADLEKVSPYTVMWREAYRLHGGDGEGEEATSEGQWVPQGLMQIALWRAMEKFDERPPREEFEQALTDGISDLTDSGRFLMPIYARRMYEALDSHAGHLEAWPHFPRGREQHNSASTS